MLVALSPDNGWEFLTAMSQAWEWAQSRPRAYCDTGGNQTIEEYLAEAKERAKKHLAVIDDGKLISVITVRLVTDGHFEIHVTSPRKTQKQPILDALKIVSENLFRLLGAQSITTTCPIYGAHEHKGSRALAEACGMTPTGLSWPSIHDESITWLEYEITKEQFYGKSEERTEQ